MEAVEKCDDYNIHLQPVLKGGFGQVGTPYMLLNGTERYHIPVGSATITCRTLDLLNGFSLKMYKNRQGKQVVLWSSPACRVFMKSYMFVGIHVRGENT